MKRVTTMTATTTMMVVAPPMTLVVPSSSPTPCSTREFWHRVPCTSSPTAPHPSSHPSLVHMLRFVTDGSNNCHHQYYYSWLLYYFSVSFSPLAFHSLQEQFLRHYHQYYYYYYYYQYSNCMMNLQNLGRRRAKFDKIVVSDSRTTTLRSAR